MPEGPSIVILKEAVQAFKGKKVLSIGGNTKVDLEPFSGQKIVDFRSWGKHFLICFPKATIRIHLLMFGSYRINEEKPNATPRLHLGFSKGELNFYTCSVQVITEPLDEIYDFSADVMNPTWSEKKARAKLKANPGMLACDALLNQDIFAGVGNIIKNEVLFRIRVDPRSRVGALPARQLKALLTEAVAYSFEFLEWKKEFTLREHWLAHTKKICPRDHVPFIKQHLGKTNRRTFYCPLCQVLYT